MSDELSAAKITARASKLKQNNAKYYSLVQLCREVYEMKKERNSNFLGPGANKWRTKVPAEYWQPSAKGHNVIDLITSILSGHKPQFKALTPGRDGATMVQSRAEKFIQGVIQLNSRRSGQDLIRDIVFRTALDGQVAIRVIWMPNAPQPDVENINHPDNHDELTTLGVYDSYEFPISIDVIPIDQVMYEGRGPYGMPFRALYHTQQLTEQEMLSIWGNVEEAQGAAKQILDEAHQRPDSKTTHDLIEYWEYNHKNEVVHAVVWKKKFIIEPHVVHSYKFIPYVISQFKRYDAKESELPAIPFLYPILHDISNSEYLSSRMYRMVDMLTGIPPIKKGGSSPTNLGGTWGELLNLKKDEDIVFPKAPGFGPDIYQVLEDIRKSMSEGTFSEATFGTVGAGISGYGLSQMLGADTTRTDTPKANIELAISQVVDLILALLYAIAPHFYLSVLCEDRGTATSAMLRGDEVKGMQVMVKMKLKSTQDEMRRYSIGAQISSMPDLPISMAWILENLFDIHQPEEEIERKRVEQALNSPVVQMMAMLQAVMESDQPPALKMFVLQQLQQQLQGIMGGGQQATGPQPATSIPNMGGGIPQAAMGTNNEPLNPMANPTAPQGLSPVSGLQPMIPQGE